MGLYGIVLGAVVIVATGGLVLVIKKKFFK
jgi:hypothetical protein